jgi:hypothetical protein
MPATSWATLAPRASSWATLPTPFAVSVSTQTSAVESVATDVHDTFTDTSGTLLDAHTSNSGATWAEHPLQTSGRCVIGGSDDIYNDQVGGVNDLAQVALPSSDYTVEALFTMLSSMVGVNDAAALLARSSRTNITVLTLGFHNNPGNWQFYRTVAGVDSLLSSAATRLVTTTESRRAQIVCSGNTANVYVDDALIMGPLSIASIADPGYAGVRFFNVAAASGANSKLHLENFRVVRNVSSVSTTVSRTTTGASWTTLPPRSTSWVTLA